MKTLIFSKSILTLTILLSFTITIRSEIIPLTSGNVPKHLPTSAASTVGGINDGTLAVWVDSDHGGSVCIQKIGLDGTLKWSANRIILDSNIGPLFNPDTDYPVLYSDNFGGAILIYVKAFSESCKIFSLKIYSDGSVTKDPACITKTPESYNYSPSSILTKDNAVVVCWESFNEGDFNINAQKIDLDGNVLWNDGNEIPVCSEIHDQHRPTIACDGDSNVVISWLDGRNSGYYPDPALDLYAKRIFSDGGVVQKNGNEKLIFSYYDNKQFLARSDKNLRSELMAKEIDSRKLAFYNHNMVESDKNSVLFAVEQLHPESDSFIKIIKADENLNITWSKMIDEDSYQLKPLIISDGSFGAYVLWNDKRDGENSIYGLGLNSEGNIKMGKEGGIKISCVSMKGSFMNTMPSDKNQNGLLLDADKVYLSWVSSDRQILNLSSVNNIDKNYMCSNTKTIDTKITEGEFTSITKQKNGIVMVYKQSNNILAKIDRNVTPSNKQLNNNKITVDNAPNPFNPVTRINFTLPYDGIVKLNVYDVRGRIIKSLINNFQSSGSHSVLFDASFLSSGIYFYRIESNGLIETKKMTLIK